MSETQFSALSPNSSYDLDPGHRLSEENDYGDQETLTITSNKSVANLDDLEDTQNSDTKIDPFLSDFVKEECDVKHPFPQENDAELSYTNHFSETDSDDCQFIFGDCLDDATYYLLDLEVTLLAGNTGVFQRQISNSISNKRALSPIDNRNITELPLPSKQRRVDVSSHVRCDEWINKYHEIPERMSLKESGMLDRRKTKHHKVLDEFDSDLQTENIDHRRDRASLSVQNKSSTQENYALKVLSHQTRAPDSISTYSSKIPTIRSINHIIRKPLIHYHDNNKRKFTYHATHIRNDSRSDSPGSQISAIQSPVNLSTSGSSRALSEIVEMPRIPLPLRMNKRVSRRGHRYSLWQFLMCLLDSNKYRNQNTGIKWLNRTNGVFHIIDSKHVATSWGQYKERRDKMTYDSLARSLRHYYKKNLMAKINNRRLVYQIAQECIQWSTETFLKKTKD